MLVLVKSRVQDEVSQVKLQVRQTDQVWYHDDMDGSSLARAIHASTSPLFQTLRFPLITHTHIYIYMYDVIYIHT